MRPLTRHDAYAYGDLSHKGRGTNTRVQYTSPLVGEVAMSVSGMAGEGCKKS